MVYIFKMMFLSLLAILITLALSQTFLTQDLNKGNYFAQITEQRDVPRFYTCGIQVFRHENVTPARQQCCQGCDCRRCWSKRLLKRRCCWRDKCDQIPAVFRNRIVKGVKFTQCHHQNWHQKWTMGEVSHGASLGIKTCPENTFMNGFRTKLSDRDGLAGLIMLCTNPRRRNQVYEVLAFDGDGHWHDWSSSPLFVTGVSLKFDLDMVVGLRTRSFQMPIINSLEIKYNFPKDFFVQPDIIDYAVITNNGMGPMKKEIELNIEKEYTQTWQNDKRQLHGIEIGKSQTSSISISASLKVPYVQVSVSQMNSKTTSELQRTQVSQGFKFGNVERYKVGQKQKDIIEVPACTKYTVQQIVYTTKSDIPYALRIGYTNGPFQQYENINGNYKGVSTSKVQTKIDSQKICDVNS